MINPARPKTTEADRRAAFAALAWSGWTFKRAMANATRRRVIEAHAQQLQHAKRLATRRHIVRPAEPLAQLHTMSSTPSKWSTSRWQAGMYRSSGSADAFAQASWAADTEGGA